MNPQVPLSLSTRGNPGIFIVVEANEFLLSAIHPAADPPLTSNKWFLIPARRGIGHWGERDGGRAGSMKASIRSYKKEE
ncbi:hypothetical protein CesoFtcFv8_019213 [Champsocephalus esox]|uniref:Uncharacterized protein n=2 Tax=Champsocephalus TaxID=52236 RepID=A0AAN8D142_CHAGU|nr:hypothetical protein CesoFtcFv8_019213 [Champsocephalus esox]KAK5914591.1 hypothetical protein CgunFtcFv8_009021 [Champsocephalus gunnari]